MDRSLGPVIGGTIRRSGAARSAGEAPVWEIAVVIALLLVVVGGVLLVVGAELFAEHVAPVANWLGITVVGVGILLAGAEPEEAATAVIAAVRDAPGLAVGDAVGANFVILTLTLGLAALVAPLPISGKVLRFGIAAAATAVAPVLVLLDGVVARWREPSSLRSSSASSSGSGGPTGKPPSWASSPSSTRTSSPGRAVCAISGWHSPGSP